MSAVDVLLRLRAQAGARTLGTPVPRAREPDYVAPTHGDAAREAEALVERLRAALARRAYHRDMEQLPGMQSTAVPDFDLGERIAPGLRLLQIDYPDPQATSIDLPWLEQTGVARADLAAFDIETTGMNAGVGVRAFLVGIADWCDDRLRVRQLLLESPAGEPHQLALLREWLLSKRVLLSYNGKSFDVPMMNGRYPLFGQAAPFADLAHLDLLTIVRRQLKDRLSNCKLGTVEREWLGLIRQHDLPSAEVPGAWRDWIRLGRDDRLKRAIAHHRQDVISLWQILNRLLAV
ncbi:exonuclease [Ahniella affigens]|uniref:Exonuclease n=1 Tax=Ahniella affigens TaxID=2021234 RepID=A0A2P1PXQ8_9GAMM|nr:ribonuclease H-like domain-containing protein [Ahniella affigens]AVP99628.1 exonuclease [Ahniella affigens]